MDVSSKDGGDRFISKGRPNPRPTAQSSPESNHSSPETKAPSTIVKSQVSPGTTEPIANGSDSRSSSTTSSGYGSKSDEKHETPKKSKTPKETPPARPHTTPISPIRQIPKEKKERQSGVDSIQRKFKSFSLRERSAKREKPPSSAKKERQRCSIESIAADIVNGDIKNVVVMVGAGISTPSGIPDFRTPGTGLYYNLRQYNIPEPEAIFDIDFFETNPKPFYTIAKELYPTGKYRPNAVHYFLRTLYEKGVLSRVYTQNIDGLERLAGIPAAKVVEAHGSFLSASCISCSTSQNTEDVRIAIMGGRVPRCKRKGCFGLVKPDIVFFGEDLPRKFFFYLRDFPQADLLIVMGTSLEVQPFAGIVDSTRIVIPRVLFNRKAVGPFTKRRRMHDVVEAGDIVQSVLKLAELLGWKEDLQSIMTQHETAYKESQAKSEAEGKRVSTNCNDNNSHIENMSTLNRPRIQSTSIRNSQSMDQIRGGTRQVISRHPRREPEVRSQSRLFQSHSATSIATPKYSSVRRIETRGRPPTKNTFRHTHALSQRFVRQRVLRSPSESSSDGEDDSSDSSSSDDE